MFLLSWTFTLTFFTLSLFTLTFFTLSLFTSFGSLNSLVGPQVDEIY